MSVTKWPPLSQEKNDGPVTGHQGTADRRRILAPDDHAKARREHDAGLDHRNGDKVDGAEENQNRHESIPSKNPRMLEIFQLITNVAATSSTVLLQGETGTGKEEVARTIHAASSVKAGPLVAVNCAALPQTLLENELFGHEKGAFTNATDQRVGRFELANGGSLFLDEVGDIPLAMQAKLLRVLQERRIERVGGSTSIEVDVRILAATNRPLQKLVQEGTFREDLYYRLNVVKIDLPPLRERTEDIPMLAAHFVKKYKRTNRPLMHISPPAMNLLLKYSWPGNIRELENAIERACVTSRGDTIAPEDLPPEIAAGQEGRVPFFDIDLERPLHVVLDELTAQVEKRYICEALKKSRGHIGRCAEICGLTRRSITTKLREYKINKADFKEL